jgi:hypothetical protein
VNGSREYASRAHTEGVRANLPKCDYWYETKKWSVSRDLPADGMSAATNKNDFGTSRWQLAISLHNFAVSGKARRAPDAADVGITVGIGE